MQIIYGNERIILFKQNLAASQPRIYIDKI